MHHIISYLQSYDICPLFVELHITNQNVLKQHKFDKITKQIISVTKIHHNQELLKTLGIAKVISLDNYRTLF